MKFPLKGLFWAARLGIGLALSLPLPALADDVLQMAKASPQDRLKSPVLESVDMNPRMPVIPLKAVQTMDTSDMTMGEAREALRSLMDAQQKMAAQMKALQAHIEKTQSMTISNQEQLQTMANQQSASTGSLRDLANRTYLTGYVESGWRAYNHGARTEEYLDANGKRGNSFDLRKIILRPHVNFTDKATWYTEVEFEDGFHEVVIEESVFNYAYKPWLNFKTGMIIPPYTQTAVNHDGPLRMLVDRPLVDQFVIPSTYYDLGAGITGVVPVGKRSALNYEVDVLNGLTDTILEEPDTSLRASRSLDYAGLRAMRPGEGIANDHFRDNNRNKTLFSRIGFSPFPGFQMSASSSLGKIDPNNRVGLHIISGDMQYRYKRLSLLGEYATAIFRNKTGVSSQGIPFSLFPDSLRGYFLQAAYNITPKLAAIAAYNYVNMDTGVHDNKMQRYSLGLRYNPINALFLKMEVQHTVPRGIFHGQEKSTDAFLTQLTFYYR